MTAPVAVPDIAARRAAALQLTQHEGLSHRAAAIRLGVSKDTIRRDLEALARATAQAARATDDQESATVSHSMSQPEAPDEPDGPDLGVLPGAAGEIVALARAAQRAAALDPEALARAEQMAHNQIPYLLTALEQTTTLMRAILPAGARHHSIPVRIAQHRLRQIAAELADLSHPAATLDEHPGR